MRKLFGILAIAVIILAVLGALPSQTYSATFPSTGLFPDFYYSYPSNASYPQACHYAVKYGNYLVFPVWNNDGNYTLLYIVDLSNYNYFYINTTMYVSPLAIYYNSTAGQYEIIASVTPDLDSTNPPVYYEGILFDGSVVWSFTVNDGFTLPVVVDTSTTLAVSGIVINKLYDTVSKYYTVNDTYLYPIADGYNNYHIVPLGTGYLAVGYYSDYYGYESDGFITYVVVSYIIPSWFGYYAEHTEFYVVPASSYMDIAVYAVNSTYYQLFTPSYLAIYDNGEVYYYPSGYSNVTVLTQEYLPPTTMSINSFSFFNITGTYYIPATSTTNNIGVYRVNPLRSTRVHGCRTRY